LALVSTLTLAACHAPANPSAGPALQGVPKVLAAETFLADIAQNVAGDRLKVDALMPIGVDPHSFEPTPADVRKVADSQVLIVNGAGVEAFLAKLLQNAGGERRVIEASAGLSGRTPHEGEAVETDTAGQPETDPHFWLDPVSVIQYVENIRDGLSLADPGGKDVYARNAEAYIGKLKDLDAWIGEQVAQVPGSRRLLVTNHESFGYFADRYGFKIVGAVVPSVSSNASPSAQQLAHLVDAIKATGAPAVFLETGANAQLAQQLAQETGIKVVAGLLTHSITEPGGIAPSYLEMMRYDTKAMVDALK
jgi:ABC-type Zn uptake system ZnuABC Zn-binding protein ZnuA